MTIAPSQFIKGEFVITPSDERGRLIAESLHAGRFGQQLHLTSARAKKADMLYRFGFDAVKRPSGDYWYRRGRSKTMRLSDATRCIEAMQMMEIQP